jgi:hypothetical protein
VFAKSVRGIIASRFFGEAIPKCVIRFLATGMLRDQPAKNAGFATTQNKKSRFCKHPEQAVMQDTISHAIIRCVEFQISIFAVNL